jgi:hypothetical protein
MAQALRIISHARNNQVASRFFSVTWFDLDQAKFAADGCNRSETKQEGYLRG